MIVVSVVCYMWTRLSKHGKINDTEADGGSYDSTPLGSENRNFSILRFLPDTLTHIAESFRYKRHLKKGNAAS